MTFAVEISFDSSDGSDATLGGFNLPDSFQETELLSQIIFVNVSVTISVFISKKNYAGSSLCYLQQHSLDQGNYFSINVNTDNCYTLIIESNFRLFSTFMRFECTEQG
jgi:hypothetical protein